MNYRAIYRAAFLFLVALLTACGASVDVKITSNSPANNSVIYVNGGDAVDFQVSGPTYQAYSEALFRIGVTGQWTVYKYEPDNYITSDVLGVLPRSRTGDRIELKSSTLINPFSFRFDVPVSDAPQYYVVTYAVFKHLIGGTWEFADSSLSWLVYAGAEQQTPPVWEGDFIVSEISDFEKLSGFSSVNGSLSVMPFSSAKDEYVSSVTSNAINVSYRLENRELKTAIPLGYINSANRISQLDALSGLISVNGNLNIFDNPLLPSLNGIENLETIAGDLLVYRNMALENIDALSFISSLGEDIYIHFNPQLTSLQGLNGLTAVNGNLSFYALDALDSLQALGGITSVAGNLQVEANEGLVTLDGLEGVTSVGKKLIIERNTILTNIEGLNQLESVGSNFSITQNQQLCNSAADQLLQLVQSRNGVGSDSITITGNDDC